MGVDGAAGGEHLMPGGGRISRGRQRAAGACLVLGSERGRANGGSSCFALAAANQTVYQHGGIGVVSHGVRAMTSRYPAPGRVTAGAGIRLEEAWRGMRSIKNKE